jgi:hypothetical protein
MNEIDNLILLYSLYPGGNEWILIKSVIVEVNISELTVELEVCNRDGVSDHELGAASLEKVFKLLKSTMHLAVTIVLHDLEFWSEFLNSSTKESCHHFDSHTRSEYGTVEVECGIDLETDLITLWVVLEVLVSKAKISHACGALLIDLTIKDDERKLASGLKSEGGRLLVLALDEAEENLFVWDIGSLHEALDSTTWLRCWVVIEHDFLFYHIFYL